MPITTRAAADDAGRNGEAAAAMPCQVANTASRYGTPSTGEAEW
jgi:hypothetical protein